MKEKKLLTNEQIRNLDGLFFHTILPGIEEDVVCYDCDEEEDVEEYVGKQKREAIEYLVDLLKGSLV